MISGILRRIVILNSSLWEIAPAMYVVIDLDIFSDGFLLLANADQDELRS